jgi:hypothetical protein
MGSSPWIRHGNVYYFQLSLDGWNRYNDRDRRLYDLRYVGSEPDCECDHGRQREPGITNTWIIGYNDDRAAR